MLSQCHSFSLQPVFWLVVSGARGRALRPGSLNFPLQALQPHFPDPASCGPPTPFDICSRGPGTLPGLTFWDATCPSIQYLLAYVSSSLNSEILNCRVVIALKVWDCHLVIGYFFRRLLRSGSGRVTLDLARRILQRK